MMIFRRSALRALLPLLAASLGACADLPTTPAVLERPVAGGPWVAIVASDALPLPIRFLPYLSPATADRVQALDREGWVARGEGEMAAAHRMEVASLRLLAEGFEEAPAPHVLAEGLSTLDAWVNHLETSVDLTEYPALAEQVAGVRLYRARAAEALLAGDTTMAAVGLAAGALRVQHFSPRAVALRVLSAADRAVRDRAALEPREAQRVRHLLASSRHALAAGESPRGLQRALYALQLLNGSELLHKEDVNPLLRCVELCD